MTDKKLTVYQMIAQVSAELAVEGITKTKKNDQQGYNFRGIDDVYNALAPIMSKVGLVILPRVTARNVVERTTKSGNALFYTTVDMEFDFVSSHDGSKHTVGMYGEAMDSADKSTNKAMSAAYKYACMQAFCIPTEGDNDADATTHEVAPKAKQEPKPFTGEEFLSLQKEIKEATAETLPTVKDKSRAAWGRMSKEQQAVIRKAITEVDAKLDDIPDYTNVIMAG